MAPIKLYLAAQYHLKDEIKKWSDALNGLGFDVISTWVTEPHPPQSGMADVPESDLFKYAQEDLSQIRQCDAFVFFSVDSLLATRRGGRHVEFGYALALNKPILVVGPKENIFHVVLPPGSHVDNIEQLKTRLEQIHVTY